MVLKIWHIWNKLSQDMYHANEQTPFNSKTSHWTIITVV